MKNKIIYLIIPMCVLLSGCNYAKNRIRDAGDIFTISGGYGIGVSGQVGPFIVGGMAASDFIGIQNGSPFIDTKDQAAQITTTVLNVKEFYSFPGDDNKDIKDRGKDLEAFGIVFTPNGAMSHHHVSPNYAHYTQLEAVVALGPSVRFGFNPGELVDFILGIFLIDIYSDDKYKSNPNDIRK